jgi:hypothetical protein
MQKKALLSLYFISPSLTRPQSGSQLPRLKFAKDARIHFTINQNSKLSYSPPSEKNKLYRREHNFLSRISFSINKERQKEGAEVEKEMRRIKKSKNWDSSISLSIQQKNWSLPVRQWKTNLAGKNCNCSDFSGIAV